MKNPSKEHMCFYCMARLSNTAEYAEHMKIHNTSMAKHMQEHLKENFEGGDEDGTRSDES